MHAIIQAISERPKSHRIGILLAVVAVISFLFWQFVYSSKLEEKTKLEEKVANLERSILDERRRAASLSRLRELVKELDQKLQLALQELPDSSHIDRLIDSISDLARKSGLEITLFTRREDKYQDFYAEVPVSISVEGNYHEVATFFDEVSHLDRIVNINQISISNPKVSDNTVNIKVDCNATTFRYLDEAERQRLSAKTEAQTQGGRRKR